MHVYKVQDKAEIRTIFKKGFFCTYVFLLKLEFLRAQNKPAVFVVYSSLL